MDAPFLLLDDRDLSGSTVAAAGGDGEEGERPRGGGAHGVRPPSSRDKSGR